MKNLVLVLLLLLIPASHGGTNLSGTWTMTTDFFSDPFSDPGRISVATCVIRQQDRRVSVRFRHGDEMTGAVEHRRAEWHWQNADISVTFAGIVAETGKTMRGTWQLHFKDDGSNLKGTFSAVKAP
jgi:hypothetical protein